MKNGHETGHATLVDERQIRWYCNQLHEAATGIDGVLVAMAICPSTDTSLDLWREHAHFAVGDVDAMVDKVIAWVRRGANTYATWAVFRPDLPEQSRGGIKDVEAVLALVADRDADTGKLGSDVVEPTIQVVSSRNPTNYNTVYMLTTPLDAHTAGLYGRHLREAMAADSGTGDSVRLTRIAGTANFPNLAKIRRGRSPDPQLVRLGDGGTGQPITPAALFEAIEHRLGRPIGDCATAPAPMASPIQGAQPEASAWANFDRLPAGLQRDVETNDARDRSEHSFKVTRALINRGMSDAEVAGVLGLFPNGAGEKFIARGDLGAEIVRCRQWEARRHVEPARVLADRRTDGPSKAIERWPELEGPAMHGISGDIARLATERTEVDPVAVLVTHIVWAGAAFGRTKFLRVGDDAHHGRLFAALVGDSSRARKGSSTGSVIRVWRKAEALDPTIPILKITHGPISTGEGIIFAVRDGESGSGDGEESDPGVQDKRLLVLETEFGAVLKALQRPGNTASAILRAAWDGNDISPLTKNSRITASAPHVSIVAHVTRFELNSLLSQSDVVNGLANRVVWLCVRRTRQVPNPAPMRDEDVDRIGRELARLTRHAHAKNDRRGEVVLTNQAADFWAHIYPEVSQDRDGVLGHLTARAEAQVLRLALTFTQLDGLDMIGQEHLEAGLALWRFSADSTALIFGDRLAAPGAEKVLAALQGGPITRTDIGALFSGHRSKRHIEALVEQLIADGRIEAMEARTPGRSATIYTIRRAK